MSASILLALAITVCIAHLSIQMAPSTAAKESSPQIQQDLEMPCDMLTDIHSPGGVIDVSRVRIVNGERMCAVPANQMPQTMDEVLEGEELNAGAFASSVPACNGVLLNKDMCLTRRQSEMIKQYNRLDNFHSGRWKRKALSYATAQWKNKVVPYELADGVFSASETDMIESAMRTWESGTCIIFRPATNSDTDKIVIQSGSGCYSRIGRVGGSQELSLGTGICRTKRVIMHELGHALGLIHEHQRDDRDNYVVIRTENVQTQFMNQFDKISRSIVDVESTKYDYRSLMHYGKSFFSKDGSSMTIQTNDPNYQDVIGRVDTLSFSDYKSINLMYQCAEFCPQRVFCIDGGYAGPNCECVCPDGTTSCSASTGSPSTNIVTAPIWEILTSIIPRHELLSILKNRRDELLSITKNRRDDFPVQISKQIPINGHPTVLSKQTPTRQNLAELVSRQIPTRRNPAELVSMQTLTRRNPAVNSRQNPNRGNPAVISRQIISRRTPADVSRQTPTRLSPGEVLRKPSSRLTAANRRRQRLNRVNRIGAKTSPIYAPYPDYLQNKSQYNKRFTARFQKQSANSIHAGQHGSPDIRRTRSQRFQ